MTIDMLGEDTILVSLQSEDMSRYALDFGAHGDDTATRQGLTRLMYRIGEECRLDHRDKSYLIEALPGHDGCLLIISVRTARHRKRYKIRRRRTVAVCRIDRVDDLLDLLSRRELTSGMGYAIYALDGGYWLLPDIPPGRALRALLSEYGTMLEADAVQIAGVLEHGALVKEQHNPHAYPRHSLTAAI